MKKYNVMVEGALFSAIFLIMLVAIAYIPPVSAVGVYFLPLPITVYAYRNKLYNAILVVVVTSILSFMFAPPIAIVNAVMASVMGAAYGTVLRKQYSPMVCFAVLIVVSILDYAFMELLVQTAFGLEVIGPSMDFIREGLESLLRILSNAGVDLSSIEVFIDLILDVLPFGVLFVLGVLNSFIIFSVTAIFFSRLRYKMVYLPTFSYSKNGGYFAIVYAILLLTLLLGFEFYVSHKTPATIIINLVLIATINYWAKGYLIVCEFYSRLKLNRLLTTIICLISFFILIIPMIFIAVYNSINYTLKSVK